MEKCFIGILILKGLYNSIFSKILFVLISSYLLLQFNGNGTVHILTIVLNNRYTKIFFVCSQAIVSRCQWISQQLPWLLLFEWELRDLETVCPYQGKYVFWKLLLSFGSTNGEFAFGPIKDLIQSLLNLSGVIPVILKVSGPYFWQRDDEGRYLSICQFFLARPHLGSFVVCFCFILEFSSVGQEPKLLLFFILPSFLSSWTPIVKQAGQSTGVKTVRSSRLCMFWISLCVFLKFVFANVSLLCLSHICCFSEILEERF